MTEAEFPKISEANASEFLENLEELILDAKNSCIRFKSSATQFYPTLKVKLK